MTAPASTYDAVPYESRVLFYTHPTGLAAIGRLFGLQPPAVERCRVLELGCATAGNLLSLAITLPRASFLGIDASARQIAAGDEQAKALGLTNVELQARDILDVGEACGTFDYILCHGVYSWVPPRVADHILEICARCLSPQGIAYVSYNTFPGWHAKAMIRDMLLYHLRRVDDPLRKVEEARAFLHVLAGSVRQEEELYKRLLAHQAEELDQVEDSYVLHEFLEDVNAPTYFHEFAAHLAGHGLQYLGPARFSAWEQVLSTDTERALHPLPRLVREQYLDFLGNRTFRRDLVCHARAPIAPTPQAGAIRELYCTTEVMPVKPAPDVDSTAVEEFQAGTEGRVTTNQPVAKAILAELAGAYPQAAPFVNVWAGVRSRLERSRDLCPSPEILAEALLRCALANLIELRSAPPPVATEIGARPLASPLARAHAGGGNPIANLRHRLVQVDGLDRIVLRHLDGAHDRAALCRRIAEAVTSDEIELQDAAGVPVRDPASITAVTGAAIEQALQRLHRQALLLPDQ